MPKSSVANAYKSRKRSSAAKKGVATRRKSTAATPAKLTTGKQVENAVAHVNVDTKHVLQAVDAILHTTLPVKNTDLAKVVKAAALVATESKQVVASPVANVAEKRFVREASADVKEAVKEMKVAFGMPAAKPAVKPAKPAAKAAKPAAKPRASASASPSRSSSSSLKPVSAASLANTHYY